MKKKNTMKIKNEFLRKYKLGKVWLLLLLQMFLISSMVLAQNPLPVIPQDLRGRIDAERTGTHDANRIRTLFYNFGMIGDYPADPLKVDLSVFHSVEVPKGSGLNYSDGTTPFVLAKIKQKNGKDAFIMETGFRERQGTSPYKNRVMRFEPRPGYFQPDPDINKGRSVAMSNDARTWPDKWIDKLDDPDDPGWSGSWDGYFGKAPGADQESYVVYDDDFYDAWNYSPDSRDDSRKGLGLRVEQRGFQWSNPQSGNVVFWHYDISNESTTSYDDNIIFGLYMDSGVGGSAISCDGVAESDDDNAFFDKSFGLNLVYTWDKNGHGIQLSGNCGVTGYLGYSYLETPGNSTDLKDDDGDGITDEKRDGGPGEKIIGQDGIRAYVNSHYNLVKFENYYGPLEQRPAFVKGIWFTGDEDMDWVSEYDDTGADGIFDTHDTGEKDGEPTSGEPYFDKTDIDESDQIGLTGFKMNRIRAGLGSPSTQVDNIVFFDDGKEWPKRLYNIFTDPDSSFDVPIVQNYNIGFLFASGTFKLGIGKRERFSLALGFGEDLRELKTTIKVVQQIYKANYQFAVPPPMPTLNAYTGDKYVTLSWDDKAERAYDPITNTNDFEGYRIYRSTDPTFLDPQVIQTARGTGPIGNGKPLAQFDLVDGIVGYSKTTVEGVGYFFGDDNGITHTFKDTTVINGQRYFYAVTAFDMGADSIEIYPSENAIAVSQTLRGGILLPKNVVEVYPNKQALGYELATTSSLLHTEGTGFGSIRVEVKNSQLVPDNHTFEIGFSNPVDSIKAEHYYLADLSKLDTLFFTGADFEGAGTGPLGNGLLPILSTPKIILIDSLNTAFTADSKTNIKFKIRYASSTLPIGLRRPGYPDNLELIFSDQPLDTTLAAIGLPKKPAKIKVVAKGKDKDRQLKYRMYDTDNNGTLSKVEEYIEVVTYTNANPTTAKTTWVITVDTTGQYQRGAIVPPTTGDKFDLKLFVPFAAGDKFTFVSDSQHVDLQKIKSDSQEKPYVVPNPYVGAASFEPQRFAVSGRGERRMEFRSLPRNATIRIFTINGELVKTLHQDGDIIKGYVSWDLRTKDNLEVAPGLYIFHVESQETDPYIGKFAIIK
ncbi:MAG: hypothetical protein NTX22_11775 [Ignavibacteriales bacterium]|nr:hypothetical protein [Ignavibacteriales bacterium]